MKSKVASCGVHRWDRTVRNALIALEFLCSSIVDVWAAGPQMKAQVPRPYCVILSDFEITALRDGVEPSVSMSFGISGRESARARQNLHRSVVPQLPGGAGPSVASLPLSHAQRACRRFLGAGRHPERLHQCALCLRPCVIRSGQCGSSWRQLPWR